MDIPTFDSTAKTGKCGGLCLAKMRDTRHEVIYDFVGDIFRKVATWKTKKKDATTSRWI
jgi:hypothetical protein